MISSYVTYALFRADDERLNRELEVRRRRAAHERHLRLRGLFARTPRRSGTRVHLIRGSMEA
ncbi:hypothetical protein WDJ51_10420 [Rathayibacter sp. YIM 133350]|uniref:hypothetical protein n=1 Tax=Rathayibacter sp. YIM 133350 TaxID=3131992 RepID=UPI00307D9279